MRFLRNMTKHTLVSSAVINCVYEYVYNLISDKVDSQKEEVLYDSDVETYPTWMSETMYGFDISKPRDIEKN